MIAKRIAQKNTTVIPAYNPVIPAPNRVIPAQAGILNRLCTIPRHAGLDPASPTCDANPQQIPAYAGMTQRNAGMTTTNNQAW